MTEIHPRLATDCVILGRLVLCHLLLMNDRNYPWFILVPDRANVSEIYQLEAEDRAQLLAESCALSEFVMRDFEGDKLNVAALGNQVPQLHLHHIVRYRSDPAWPGPVWGKQAPVSYAQDELADIRKRLSEADLPGFESV